MPQITIYLDEETAKMMETSARKAGLSKSKWIAEAVRTKSSGEWSQSVKDLVGAWQDFPDLDEIRKSTGTDVKRELL
ncbi:MAG: CopG family transcriptional regulator [Acidobacteriota bacterium]